MISREDTRLEIQASLDSQKSQKERNIMGQFATPSKLASDILSHARRLITVGSSVRFLDPAIGTGSFYSALRTQFEEAEISTAQGFEIDPHYGTPAIRLWQDSLIDIRIEDFTTVEIPVEPNKPNLIICNPPYVRHHHINGPTKARLAAAATRCADLPIGGLAGLYCYFIAIAHAWLSEDGIAGWLIPSEFMDVNYGAAIRRYLTESVELIQIHRFDPADLQFGDAQVSSAVVWFRKRKPKSNHFATMSYGGTLSNPLVARQTPLRELRLSSKWSAMPHGETQPKFGDYTLSDMFRIKRGLATGDNKFFVLSEDKAAQLSVPRQFLRPVLPSPRYIESDIVEADECGMPTSVRRLYLLDCPLSEEEVSDLSASLSQYLESGREKATQTYICSRRSPWYSQELRPPAPIVCTYMGRGLQSGARPFRFILNQSNATALNVYLMLYPKPILARALEIEPELIFKIWEILNKIPAETLLGEGRVYGGGLYKMEPKELANVPADAIMALLPEIEPLRMVQGEMFSDLVA
jgi:adenine-specific DNA-methyltransferase